MCDTMRAGPGAFLGANPEALLRDCPVFRGQSKKLRCQEGIGAEVRPSPVPSLLSKATSPLRDVGDSAATDLRAGGWALSALGLFWLMWPQKNSLHSTRHFIAVYFAVDSFNGSFFGARGTKHAAPQADRIVVGSILLVVKTHQT